MHYTSERSAELGCPCLRKCNGKLEGKALAGNIGNGTNKHGRNVGVLLKIEGDRRDGADVIHLEAKAPDTTVESTWSKEQGEVILDVCLGVGILGREWVEHVVEKEGTHHGVGSLLHHDLHWLEVMHTTVSCSERSIVND